MLVLSRKTRERLEFILPDGRLAAVLVVGVVGGRVKLGCDFPRDVKIWREGMSRHICPSDTIAEKVAEIQEASRKLLVLINSLDKEVTNPQAMKAIDAARQLIGDVTETTGKSHTEGATPRFSTM